ncbi:MAG TPA: GIY-YIG nuclease family protein [Candidatus Paceibacterota bacterium]|nr:GIY-YIG nuclease family protein [Candidatus Paceibacterota bacterium]
MIRQDLDNLKLPQVPGVYFWKDANGKILYIGKATNLRDRTRSYFAPDLIKTRGPHMVDMVFKSSTVEWQETDSVLEALILEANLIKKCQPYYNRQEKDDKSFNCVAITKEAYPRILLVRQKDIDTGAKTVRPLRSKVAIKYDAVFGPYPHGSQLKEALRIIRGIFPFRDRASAMKDKEVFYQQIELSPKTGSDAAKRAYRKNIGRIKLILQGKLKSLVKELTTEMNAAAKKMQFEAAGELKQKIFALTHIQDVSLMKRDLIMSHVEGTVRIEAYDIAHLSGKQMVGVMTVIENATPAKSEYRKFIIRGFDKANDAGALREVITRRLAHTEWPYPTAIVVDGNAIHVNVARSVFEKLGIEIPIVAVTKDARHKPVSISGPQSFIEAHKYAILLANNEAHRFALSFHRHKRQKAQLR